MRVRFFFYFFIFTIFSLRVNVFCQDIQHSFSSISIKDTSFTINSNSLLDNNNTHLYRESMEPKYYPWIQPLKKFAIKNIDTIQVENLSYYFNEFFNTNQDSLSKQIINNNTDATELTFRAYNYLKDKSVYYYVSENSGANNNISFQESHGLLNAINTYGYYACGANALNMSRLLAYGLKKTQYDWEIYAGAHSVSETHINGENFYIDADKESFYKQLNNTHLASFKDVLFDPFLYTRTKIFGSTLDFAKPNFDQIIGALQNSKWEIDTNGKFTNIGNQIDSNKIFNYNINLRPNEEISFLPDSIMQNFHLLRANNYIDSVNDYNNLSIVSRTGIQNYDINTNSTIKNIANYYKNVSKINDSLFEPIVNDTTSILVFKNSSPYTIVDGFVKSKVFLATNQDSLSIFFSKDSINWLKICSSDTIIKNTTVGLNINLKNLFNTKVETAYHDYFIKFVFQAKNNISNCKIQNIDLISVFQFSKFCGPILNKGNNKIVIYKKDSTSKIQTTIDWVDYFSRIPPSKPASPIFPANNSSVTSTNFVFNWTPSSDIPIAINTYQIQVSERRDFLYPISTNFDRYLYLVSDNQPYFIPEIKNFYANNTQYYWRVRAQDITGVWSEWSDVWTFNMNCNLSQPKHLHFELVNNNIDSVRLKWDTAPLNENIVKYYLYRNDTRACGIDINNTLPFDSTTFNYYDITSKTNILKYRVVAVNSFGDLSVPSYNVNHPYLTSLFTNFGKKENAKSYFLNKLNLDIAPIVSDDRLPWPVISGDDRESFIIEDTTSFIKQIDSTYKINFIGNRLLNCYTKLYNDTVLQFQILYQSSIDQVCNTSYKNLSFPLLGSPPWELNYNYNGNILTYVTSDPNLNLQINNGIYFFDNYKDVNNAVYTIHQLYSNDSSSNIQKTFSYDCDSAKMKLNIKFSGLPPTYLNFYQNGVLNSNILYDYNSAFYFNSGNYQFLNISDSKGCVSDINEDFTFNYTPITATLSTPIYNCDSNKTEIALNVQGNAPFTLHYTQDGIAKTYITSTSSNTLFLTNGLYNFINLSDSTGCSQFFNQTFTFNYTPINATLSTPIYNCDSNKTEIALNVQGNAPFTLHYTQDGIAKTYITSTSSNTLLLANGLYNFINLSDSTGCSQSFNQTFTFNYTPITATLSTPIYNCDSNKTEIALNVQGNAPFTLHYTQDGIAKTYITSTSSNTLLLANGLYNFINLSDSTGCSQFFNQTFTFNYTPINATLSTPIYNCDSNKTEITLNVQGNAPFTLHYTQDGIAKTYITSTSSNTLFLTNGLYNFINLSDSTGCSQFFNQTFTFNYNVLTSSHTAPHYNCDSNKTEVKFSTMGNAPFVYTYIENGLNKSLTTNNTNQTILLSNGTTQLQNVIDATGCTQIFNENYTFNYTPINATLSTPIYNCDSNKTEIALNVQGNAPFTLHYTQDGIAKTYITSTSSNTLFLTNGLYNFINLSDSTGCSQSFNQTFTFNYTPITATLSTPIYNCDSNKTEIALNVQGNAPFTLHYTQDGIAKTYITSTSSNTLFLTNGLYNFINLSDSTGCSQFFNQTFTFNYTPINATLSTPIYNCDSNKTEIALNVQGNAPFTLHYTQDGIAKTYITSTSSNTLLLANGLYNFINLSDSTGCSQSFNQTFTFNYTPITATLSTPIYNCDSNKTEIALNVQGNAPFTLHYTQDGIAKTYITSTSSNTLLLANGLYNFINLSDSTGCSQFFNQTFTFNYTPINATLSTPIYNCDSNKTEITLNVQGNAPFTLHYTQDGIAKTYITSTSSNTLFLTNGLYNFINLSDSTGCSQFFNQTFTFNYTPITATLSTPIYNCDSNKTEITLNVQGNAPFTLHYTQDGIAKTYITSTSSNTLFLTNGLYNFINLSDSTGCSQFFNQTFTFNYNVLTSSHTAPHYNCDSNKTEVKFSTMGNAPFVYTYIENGLNKSLTTNNTNQTILLSNGTTQLQNVIDATGCTQIFNENYTFNYTPINATLSTPIYNCDSNKTEIALNVQGNAPFTLHYTQDGIAKTYITSTSSNTLLLANGLYNFINLSDSTGCSQFFNQTFTFNYTPINATLSTPIYNCDSNKTEITLNVQGNAPFTLHYTQDGIAKTYITSTSSNTLFLTNGLYNFINLSDSTGCSQFFNQTFTFNYNVLTSSHTAPHYNCDSNKTEVKFSTMGNAPFVYTYIENGLNKSLTTNNTNQTILLSNGTTQLQNVIEATGCTQIFNENYTFNYTPINATLSTPIYNCDSNKTEIALNVQGNAPFTLHYTQDGIAKTYITSTSSNTLFLTNGLYNFINLSDSTGCSQSFNQTFTFNYTPITATLSTPIYNCDSNKTEIALNVQGNAPFTLHYTQDGIAKTYITSTSSNTLFLTNGLYNFINLSDSTGCTFYLHKEIKVNNKPVNARLTSIDTNCKNKNYAINLNFNGVFPFKLQYNYLNLPNTKIINDTTYSLVVDSGIYYFTSIVDSNNCSKELNFNSDSLLPFNIQMPTLYLENNKLIATPDFASYAWYKNDTLIIKNNVNTLLEEGNGNYYVVTTDYTNCETKTSSIDITYVNTINVFPTPSIDYFKIAFNSKIIEPWFYSLYDNVGNIVKKGKSANSSEIINIKDLGAAIYYLKINYTNGYNIETKLVRVIKIN